MLGAILIHNDAFNHAAEVIDAQRFLPRRAPPHLREDGRAQRARRGDRLRHAEGGAVAQRASSTKSAGRPTSRRSPTACRASANVEYYARIVKEKSTLRSLIHSANKILAEAYEAEQEPDLLLDEAERAIFAIAEDRIRAGFVPLRDLVQSSFATIEKLQQHKGLVTGVPTGFVDLDEMTSRAAAVATWSSSPRGRRWARPASC